MDISFGPEMPGGLHRSGSLQQLKNVGRFTKNSQANTDFVEVQVVRCDWGSCKPGCHSMLKYRQLNH